jgi:hypothetical protein
MHKGVPRPPRRVLRALASSLAQHESDVNVAMWAFCLAAVLALGGAR